MAAKKTTSKTSTSPAAKTEPAAVPKADKTTKKAAKKAINPATPAKQAPPVKSAKKSAKPTLEELTRAAYLNYRRRVELGLPGDSHGDWLEAERTLGEP